MGVEQWQEAVITVVVAAVVVMLAYIVRLVSAMSDENEEWEHKMREYRDGERKTWHSVRAIRRKFWS